MQPAEPVHRTIANRPADLGALLGVWLAGAVAVPVHRAAPAAASDRLRRTTGARFALDAGALAVIAAAPPRARDLLAGAALVLFTSGGTGQPKGVVLDHRRFAGKLAVLARLALRPGDVVLVPLQLTFVFGLWVSLLAVLAGARLVLVPRARARWQRCSRRRHGAGGGAHDAAPHGRRSRARRAGAAHWSSPAASRSAARSPGRSAQPGRTPVCSTSTG